MGFLHSPSKNIQIVALKLSTIDLFIAHLGKDMHEGTSCAFIECVSNERFRVLANVGDLQRSNTI